MKFLTFLSLLLVSFQTFSQDNSAIAEATNEETLGQHLGKNLRVGYFGEFLGPSLKKADDNLPSKNRSDNYRGSDPIQTFNQFSFNYDFGYKMNFIINPRFISQHGDRNDMADGDDQHVIQWDDLMIGFQGVPYSNDRFSYWVRLTYRHPTSHFSRQQGHNSIYEYFHQISYDLTPKWQLGSFNFIRYYDYKTGVGNERYRIYSAPYIVYTINERLSFMPMLEYEVQHRNANGVRSFDFMKKSYSDLYVGLNVVVNKSLTLYPFLKFIDESDIRYETTQVGAWIMGRVF